MPSLDILLKEIWAKDDRWRIIFLAKGHVSMWNPAGMLREGTTLDAVIYKVWLMYYKKERNLCYSTK